VRGVAVSVAATVTGIAPRLSVRRAVVERSFLSPTWRTLLTRDRAMSSLRFFAGLALALSWSACVTPPPPAERASDAARQLNVASRFGELASVIDMTSPRIRERFQERRAAWGKDVRVVDVELASLDLADARHAKVVVDFSWTRTNEGTLRATRVMQEWEAADGPWLLVREKRVSGDLGLFGERVAMQESAPRPDVQFPTRVIR
jgi:hypothetical protein